jgi:hypothetical protein
MESSKKRIRFLRRVFRRDFTDYSGRSSGPDFTVSFRTEKTGKARKTILRNFPGKTMVYIPDKYGRGKRDEKRGKIRNLFYGKKREKFPGFFRKPFPFPF